MTNVKKEAKKVTTLKKKSFADLIKLKEKIDITNDEEILFVLEELGNVDFETAYKIFWDSNINKEKEKETQEDINKKILPFSLRKMFKSDSFEINGLSDNEILQTIEQLGENISLQVNDALDKLLMSKLLNRFKRHIEQIKQYSKQIEEMNKVMEDITPPEVEEKVGE